MSIMPLVTRVSLIPKDYMLWAFFLFLMPVYDEPALDDVTELDNQRDFWGLVSLAILLLIVLPAPGFLTHMLYL